MIRRIGNRTLVAKIAMTVVLGAGAGVAAIPAASAATGNTVNNCYGAYYTTSWHQGCKTGGAAATGQYISTADCNLETDNSINVWRYRGDRSNAPGEDCNWRVDGVSTVFK